jgi:hypothetical protein
MNFTDIYLCFPDAETALELLYTQDTEILNEDGDILSIPRFVNIDHIGIIYEGEDQTPLAGEHYNIRLLPHEDAAYLEEFMVHPKNPVRVWA